MNEMFNEIINTFFPIVAKVNKPEKNGNINNNPVLTGIYNEV